MMLLTMERVPLFLSPPPDQTRLKSKIKSPFKEDLNSNECRKILIKGRRHYRMPSKVTISQPRDHNYNVTNSR